MKTVPIRLRPDVALAWASAQQLELTLETTVRLGRDKAPHFHFRLRGESRGVLEHTYSPATGEAWLSVHKNRTQPWVEALLQRVETEGP